MLCILGVSEFHILYTFSPEFMLYSTNIQVTLRYPIFGVLFVRLFYDSCIAPRAQFLLKPWDTYHTMIVSCCYLPVTCHRIQSVHKNHSLQGLLAHFVPHFQ